MFTGNKLKMLQLTKYYILHYIFDTRDHMGVTGGCKTPMSVKDHILD